MKMIEAVNCSKKAYLKVWSGTGDPWWIPLGSDLAKAMAGCENEWQCQYSEKHGNLAFEARNQDNWDVKLSDKA